MSDVVATVAVLGRHYLIPTIHPIKLADSDILYHVSWALNSEIVLPNERCIDTRDCTVFTVALVDQGGMDIGHSQVAKQLLEDSLSAISEVTIWGKAQDIVGGQSSFLRQVGITDVKAFFVKADGPQIAGWENPVYRESMDAAAHAGMVFGNMIFNNGPAANPIPAVTRRVMGSLDLINLGFYTESFITLFSLIDSLTQSVIMSGMAKCGLNEAKQKSKMKEIKSDRLKKYLCNLTKQYGWKSIEDDQPELFDRVVAANLLRNEIMHASNRLLNKPETIKFVSVLLDLIDWLRTNSFGFFIPTFPNLHLAAPTFSLYNVKSTQPPKER